MTAKRDPRATRRFAPPISTSSLLCDVAYLCSSELHPTLWFGQVNPVLTLSRLVQCLPCPLTGHQPRRSPLDRHRQWTPLPHYNLLACPLISLTPSRRNLYILRLPAFLSIWVLMILHLQLLATPCPIANWGTVTPAASAARCALLDASNIHVMASLKITWLYKLHGLYGVSGEFSNPVCSRNSWPREN